MQLTSEYSLERESVWGNKEGFLSRKEVLTCLRLRSRSKILTLELWRPSPTLSVQNDLDDNMEWFGAFLLLLHSEEVL